jgi:hypothetical protein
LAELGTSDKATSRSGHKKLPCSRPEKYSKGRRIRRKQREKRETKQF